MPILNLPGREARSRRTLQNRRPKVLKSRRKRANTRNALILLLPAARRSFLDLDPISTPKFAAGPGRSTVSPSPNRPRRIAT